MRRKLQGVDAMGEEKIEEVLGLPPPSDQDTPDELPAEITA